MAKTKTIYICQQCGYQSAKWLGKCVSCGSWNTLIEEKLNVARGKADVPIRHKENMAPRSIADIGTLEIFRITTNDYELNRVLGGGIVPGSVVLVAGEPGIGKSTLLLQVAMSFEDTPVLYVSGEESIEQVAMRAQRIGRINRQCYVVSETDTEQLIALLNERGPALVIIDSVQTLRLSYMESLAGSISQIRESAAVLQRYAKESGTPVFLIGHITKEGAIAGPKVLEHIVDTVLQFEGDAHYNYRILRSMKNRFGSTSEIGIYEMGQDGLRGVTNPSELLLSQHDELLSGIAIAATVEGMRPLLLEVQALVTKAVFGTPQRSVTGYDLRRLHMLLAVLDKRLGFHFGMHDVFLNIAGGIRIGDPALDLAVVCALLSSYEDVAISTDFCFVGEVGLSGEIRPVSRLELRIAEADRLGFKKIFVSSQGIRGISLSRFKIEVVKIAKVQELIGKLF